MRPRKSTVGLRFDVLVALGQSVNILDVLGNNVFLFPSCVLPIVLLLFLKLLHVSFILLVRKAELIL